MPSIAASVPEKPFVGNLQKGRSERRVRVNIEQFVSHQINHSTFLWHSLLLSIRSRKCSRQQHMAIDAI
jgi:hypothetical protein